MLGFFKISAIGKSHLAKSDGVCQDYSDVVQTNEDMIIAAIADGLGSAEKSDIGSQIAVKTVLDHISGRIKPSKKADLYINALHEAFQFAYRTVITYAKNQNDDSKMYNTTLTVAIYNGKDLYYGQCGDGGIVALTYDGDYICVTDVMKGEEFNETFPLLCGEGYWTFGKADLPICAFTMMTDGIYDIVCSPLLANEKQKIYVPFIRRFMDRNVLKANDPEDFRKLQESISAFISGNGIPGVTDDKTIVGVINTKVVPKLKDEEYYREPDWKALKRKQYEIMGREYNTSSVRPHVTPQKSADVSENYRAQIDDCQRKLAEEKAKNKKLADKLMKALFVESILILILIAAILLLVFGSEKKSGHEKKAESGSSFSAADSKKEKKKTEKTDDLSSQPAVTNIISKIPEDIISKVQIAGEDVVVTDSTVDEPQSDDISTSDDADNEPPAAEYAE